MPDFSYQTLDSQEIPKTSFVANGKTYNFHTENSAFAIFEPPPEQWADHPEIQSPWKIHLNVQKESLAQVWELVQPMLMANDVPSFKVSRLSKGEGVDDNSAARVTEGAQITIYIQKGKEFEFNNLIAKIEQKLLAEGIQPGQFADSDRKVGTFVSVRGAGVVGGEHPYLNADQTGNNYNPHELQDPFVVQESKLQADFAAGLNQYLKSDYVQDRIKTAITQNDPGMLTRLFDKLAHQENIMAYGNQLLTNTEAAIEAGNLPGYLSQFSRGNAQVLFNQDMSDLHPSVIEAIGKANYDMLILNMGSKKELVTKIIQATVIFHTAIVTDAMYSRIGIKEEEKRSEEQNEALVKFTNEITVPSQEVQVSLTPEALLHKEFLPEPKQTVDLTEKNQAVAELENLFSNLQTAQDLINSQIANLEKWGESPESSAAQIQALKGLDRTLGMQGDKIQESIEKSGLPKITAEALRQDHASFIRKIDDFIENKSSSEAERNMLSAIVFDQKSISTKQEAISKLGKLYSNLEVAENQLEIHINNFKKWGHLKEKPAILKEKINLLEGLKANLAIQKNEIAEELKTHVTNPGSTAQTINESIERHKETIGENFKNNLDSEVYNPREKRLLEIIWTGIVSLFTGFQVKYEPKEVKAAKQDTTNAKEALTALKAAIEKEPLNDQLVSQHEEDTVPLISSPS
ncbi:hypothetical protein Lqui_0280 [Legionella quinlivanii]|uniref:Uncharacterized protein n=1 Tax=Legionella quinlivanii TaxID=45073 RepID=A0A0W0Y379_9GAMM|nr:hypothetical protein [Legionella quinlivanii]KTD51436.1 hypothetical protein Lqui_0280 [Legionella quinlivanii]SEG10744.1 virulence-associated protein [Legionella quinlivanii DSM 21216]STY10196.1 type III effector phosphothreonine lyase [Legionella quinlivanii]